MAAEPERLEQALIAVWEVKGIETYCDYCSRNARFQVYSAGQDCYCCGSHVRIKLRAAIDATNLVVSYG